MLIWHAQSWSPSPTQTYFLSLAKCFKQLSPWIEVQGNSPRKALGRCWEIYTVSPSWGQSAIGSRDPRLDPKGLTEVTLSHLGYQNCKQIKQRFSCLLPQKPNLWGRCWCKRKEVLFGCCTLGRMMDSCLRDHLNLPAQAQAFIGIERGGPFSYLSIFLAFGALGPYPSIFLAFGMIGSYPFIFLSFCVLGVRTSPCCHPCQQGRLSGTLTDCLW